MRKLAQRWEIVVFGDVGHDAYLLTDSTCVMRPAGSAFNIGYGLLSARAAGTLVATVPERFDRKHLDAFKRGEVRVIERAIDPRFDQLYLFDMRNGPTDLPIFLGTAPPIQDDEAWTQLSLNGSIVHIGTMKTDKVAATAEHVRKATVPGSTIVSANLYLDYLRQNAGASRVLLELCDLLFLNASEFALMCAEVGQQALCDGRTLVVNSGAAGATLIVNGTPVFHYRPKATRAVCTVGAGDVLIGAFLGIFAQAGDPTLALTYACEAAARSTTDYGVTRSLDVYTGFRAPEDALPLMTGDALGFASIVDSQLLISSIPDGYQRIEATGLFVVRDGKLLLIEKVAGKELVEGVLYVPGGKLDPGETPEQCAARELAEETTLGVAASELISVFTYLDPKRQRAYKFYQFLITPTAGVAEAHDDISAIHWTAIEQLDNVALFGLSRAQILLLRLGRRLA